MKFLYSSSGELHPGFIGAFTSPSYGVSRSIKSGCLWAGDNGAFKGFDKDKFFSWLKRLEVYRDKCLFISVPDFVGNSDKTKEMFYEYENQLQGWPLAFVCQDGVLVSDIPKNISAIFIGGSTKWKLSKEVYPLIKWGLDNNKHIHIGRVNYFKRYRHFREIPGSDNFTCDGTRIRFQRSLAIHEWLEYQQKSIPVNYSVFDSYCSS